MLELVTQRSVRKLESFCNPQLYSTCTFGGRRSWENVEVFGFAVPSEPTPRLLNSYDAQLFLPHLFHDRFLSCWNEVSTSLLIGKQRQDIGGTKLMVTFVGMRAQCGDSFCCRVTKEWVSSGCAWCGERRLTCMLFPLSMGSPGHLCCDASINQSQAVREPRSMSMSANMSSNCGATIHWWTAAQESASAASFHGWPLWLLMCIQQMLMWKRCSTHRTNPLPCVCNVTCAPIFHWPAAVWPAMRQS